MGLPRKKKKKKKKKTHKDPSRMSVSKLQQLRHRTRKMLKKIIIPSIFTSRRSNIQSCRRPVLKPPGQRLSVMRVTGGRTDRRRLPTSPVKRTLPPLLSRPSFLAFVFFFPGDILRVGRGLLAAFLLRWML